MFSTVLTVVNSCSEFYEDAGVAFVETGFLFILKGIAMK